MQYMHSDGTIDEQGTEVLAQLSRTDTYDDAQLHIVMIGCF